jgi:SpoU rRNA methylase family enzyme
LQQRLVVLALHKCSERGKVIAMATLFQGIEVRSLVFAKNYGQWLTEIVLHVVHQQASCAAVAIVEGVNTDELLMRIEREGKLLR